MGPLDPFKPVSVSWSPGPLDGTGVLGFLKELRSLQPVSGLTCGSSLGGAFHLLPHALGAQPVLGEPLALASVVLCSWFSDNLPSFLSFLLPRASF